MQISLKARVPRIDLITVKRAVAETEADYKRLIAFRVKEILEQQFEAQGTIEGEWAELAESTVKRKGHSVILYESGELSLSPFAEMKSNGDWTAGVRSDKFDPRFHEFGTSRMPARPMVGPATRQANREIILRKNPVEKQTVMGAFADKIKGWLKW